jgi:hypothetical protein
MKLDNDMAGRHRARNKSIQIIRTATVAAKDCKRPTTLQFHVSNCIRLIYHTYLLTQKDENCFLYFMHALKSKSD